MLSLGCSQPVTEPGRGTRAGLFLPTQDSPNSCPHKKLWCVFQPHTYSRTISFKDEICRALSLADSIILVDIYAAREKDPGTISSKILSEEIRLEYGKPVYYFPSFEETEKFLSQNLSDGDLLITMGAGNVVKIGEDLLKG